jgi:hypothetical protein
LLAQNTTVFSNIAFSENQNFKCLKLIFFFKNQWLFD